MPAEKAQGCMTGFCCAPGLTRRDIADVLAVLPSGLASQMPIVAMRGKHAAHPDKLIFASESLLYLCGAKISPAFSAFFPAARETVRDGSPMSPRISVSMPRPPLKRCISASAGLREPSLSFAAAPVPDERRRCSPVRSSMFLTGRRRQLSLRRAPIRRPAQEPWATGANPLNRVRQRPRSARRGRAPEAAAKASKRSCAAKKAIFAS